MGHGTEAPGALFEGGAIALTLTLSLGEREHILVEDGAHLTLPAPRRAGVGGEGQLGDFTGCPTSLPLPLPLRGGQAWGEGTRFEC